MGTKTIRVAKFFAGVVVFRLALDGYHDLSRPEWDMPAACNFETIWANLWEPPGTEAKQFAWRCYEERFGRGSCVNEDIAEVLDSAECGEYEIPDVDMVVGDFPCQDYLVARPLSLSGGIEGEKGVLWWSIYRFLQLKHPKYCLFENMDRLLKSPARQRGREFAIILSCLANLGYSVEWRVVNSAEYGFPQRRKRVFIYVERRIRHGVMARALPVHEPMEYGQVLVPDDAYVATQEFNVGGKASPFETAGAVQNFVCATAKVVEDYHGPRKTLGDVLIPEEEVPDSYFAPKGQLSRWQYLKGSKHEPRVDKRTGHEYFYSEGAMAFPVLPENPSRTILTGEGGFGVSRFKHIVRCESGRHRRLHARRARPAAYVPEGLDRYGDDRRRRAFLHGQCSGGRRTAYN